MKAAGVSGEGLGAKGFGFFSAIIRICSGKCHDQLGSENQSEHLEDRYQRRGRLREGDQLRTNCNNGPLAHLFIKYSVLVGQRLLGTVYKKIKKHFFEEMEREGSMQTSTVKNMLSIKCGEVPSGHLTRGSQHNAEMFSRQGRVRTERPFEVMGTADTKTGREESTGCLPSRQLSMVRAQTALGKETGGMPVEGN